MTTRKPKTSPTGPDELRGLDEWADKIAALEADVAAAVALAADRRLPKSDRDFAQASVTGRGISKLA